MGGRIYDPTLGRFLQADPHIQAPKNSQSYNRYAYVLNNPMSYTDPSGYFFKKLFKGINKALGKFAPIFGIALMFIPGMQAWAAQSLWHAAAVGFGIGGVSTGSLKGALIGAFSGAAFHQIGTHFGGKFSSSFADATLGQQAQWAGSHALAGGVASSLSGGKFGHGFFSAGFTKFAMGNAGFNYDDVSSGAIAERTVVAAVIGGTSSVISGGKFANGAQTAAMAHLFNAETTNYIQKTADQYPFGVEASASLSTKTPEALLKMEDAYHKIRINYAKGKYAEMFAAGELFKAFGAKEIFWGGVTIDVGGKLRFPDLSVIFDDGSIGFVEVKAGAARLIPRQIRLDRVIESRGALIKTAPLGFPTGRIGPTNTMLARVLLE